MGGRYGGDIKRPSQRTTWRVSVEVLAAIGREVKPRRRRRDPPQRMRNGVPA